jgi:hypothetical protein
MIDFVRTVKPLLTTVGPVVIEEETEAHTSGLATGVVPISLETILL